MSVLYPSYPCKFQYFVFDPVLLHSTSSVEDQDNSFQESLSTLTSSLLKHISYNQQNYTSRNTLSSFVRQVRKYIVSENLEELHLTAVHQRIESKN